MRIVLATYGSRGDVQPLLALALGLGVRGHRVTLAGPPEWQSRATSLGIPYTRLGSDVSAFLGKVEAAHSLKAALAFRELVLAETRMQFKHLPDMIHGAELVVGASLCLALPSVAQALAIPYRYLLLTPQMLPSGAHPCPIFRRQNLPAWANRLGWRLDMLLQKLDLLPTLNRHRRRLGLSPLNQYWGHLLGEHPILACDADLAPVPADVMRPVAQTGYLHLEGATRLSAEEEIWLAAGPRPLYAGFGSMPPKDGRRWIPMVVAAARALGQRLVLKVEERYRPFLPQGQDLLMGTNFPHGALFPKMRAGIHHGGAGTTAAVARSGVPQIIVPHILDQYYWAERIHRLGLGPAPIWRAKLTRQRIQQAMTACIGDADMVRRAADLRARIQRQSPIAAAIQALTTG